MWPNHPAEKRKDQTKNYPNTSIDTPQTSRLTSNPDEPEPLLNQAASCLKISDDGDQASGRAVRYRRHGGTRSAGSNVCCDGLAGGTETDPVVRTGLDSSDPNCSLRNS